MYELYQLKKASETNNVFLGLFRLSLIWHLSQRSPPYPSRQIHSPMSLLHTYIRHMKLYDIYCTPIFSIWNYMTITAHLNHHMKWLEDKMKVMIQTGIGWKRGKSSNPVNSLLSYSPVKVITYLGFGPLRITSTAWKGLFYDDE